MKDIYLFKDDFSGFPLGPFPYDKEHSAMGEYHYYPNEGYTGKWYDPIVSYNYNGPTWLVTSPFMDNQRCMEQMRIDSPREKEPVPILVTGETDWTDYTVTVKMRPLTAKQPCGVLFRYQTSLMHYGLFLVSGGVELHRITKLERKVLFSVDIAWECNDFHDLTVQVSGELIEGYLDGEKLLEWKDDRYIHGCIALSACMPTQYISVSVLSDKETYSALQVSRIHESNILSTLQQEHAQPVLWKSINLKNFGAGRQIRFGHLTGTEELFFVMCQHQRRVYKDRYPFISCMTAVSMMTGEILWQLGEPRDSEDIVHLTTDLPFQIYDIDEDGTDEVITSWDFKLLILDGHTGKIKNSIETPKNIEPPKTLCGIEFNRHAFHRLNVDAIRIVNVSGKERPSDILIKDRYSRIWIYDNELKLKWTFTHNNTGHFPYSHDFNGDGKDEIFSCYNMIDSNGKLMWKLPIDIDHTDEIVVGKLDPSREEEILAIVSGWEGFMLVDKNGKILSRDINGHGQRISVGNYCPERKGSEICTTTYWGNQGIIYLYDCQGTEIWHREMNCNGNIIAPVNWDGNGTELILLNGNPENGGLIDGNGRIVVKFPRDNHPELCAEVLNVTGDSRDEIILWDQHHMVIYTQNRELPESDKEYVPHKYPIYNSSNYRGEYSFQNWKTNR